VIVLHGGAWTLGNKSTASEISSILVKKGCVAVTPSYRLTTFSNQNIKTLLLIETIILFIVGYFSKSNQRGLILLLIIFFTLLLISYALSQPRKIIQHPTHVKDVVQVIKWTHANIQNFGGDPNNIFILGHSAGAHLAAIVSTNPMFLREEGMEIDIIKGTICLSGVFSDKRMKRSNVGAEILKTAFGIRDEYIDAFPIYHTQINSPPHLLLNAGVDYTLKRHTFDYANALREKGVYAKTNVYPETNHFNIRHKWGGDNNHILQDIVQFIYEVNELNLPNTLK
jgi:acetyl esterase/lipase